MNKRTFRIVAGVGAAALAITGVTAGVSFAGETPVADKSPSVQADSFLGGKPSVPAAIAVPAGNALTSVFKAHGVQNYGCTAGAWALLEPAAVLTGLSVKPVRPAGAIHFRGPSWQSDSDGSLVEGTPGAKTAPSATPNSIPQLLVTAKVQDPAVRAQAGIFADVTFIQRLNTKGGVAPAGACTAGQTAAVKYTADYRFFKKA